MSPDTKLLASEANATNRPSPLIDGRKLPLVPSVLPVATFTRSVVCAEVGKSAIATQKKGKIVRSITVLAPRLRVFRIVMMENLLSNESALSFKLTTSQTNN